MARRSPPRANGTAKDTTTAAAAGSTTTEHDTASRPAEAPYHVSVSLKFLILTTLSTTLLAFTVGRAARIILLDGISKTLLYTDPEDSSMWDRPDYHELLEDRQVRAAQLLLEERAARDAAAAAADGDGGGAGGGDAQRRARVLPEPRLDPNKEPPRTIYSSKKFDLEDRTASSSDVHIVKDVIADHQAQQQHQAADGGEGSGSTCADSGGGSCTRGGRRRPDLSNDIRKAHPTPSPGGVAGRHDGIYGDVEEEHLPAGQHLLVDIKNVDGNFLNSESRLAKAMVDVVADGGLTLLSYHCHSLKPLGVSCVGVLLESHVSFHTWPEEGVITLDLFTCGSKPLVPTLPLIEEKFGVPMVPETDEEVVSEPVVLWSHKLRGFRDGQKGARDPLASDLGQFMLDVMDFDLKRELISTQSDFQRIDIYEVIRPRFNDLLSYHKSISNDGSYEANHPELYVPDRVVFLDGVMQSTLYGDEAYHELLVHPGMFAHPDPKRVAIIGGGEGATLREVLKHNTVETATMIEIDEVMVNVCREYLPSWSDCSSFGAADWCVEDPRADVRYEDALAWFMDRFAEDGSKKSEGTAPFDVIIMDALDPQDNIPFAAALYDNAEFLEALYDGMSDDGVIIMQLGEAPSLADPAENLSNAEKRAAITRLIEEVGFESMHIYEDSGHSQFMFPWTYLVAFKSYETRVNWYLNEAEVDVNIHERILRTKDGKNPLKFFDGATMVSKQVPHKTVETVFCRESPMPEECEEYRGFDPETDNAPVSSFEVKPSGEKGFGLFAKVDIPEGYLIASEETYKSVKLLPTTHEMIKYINDEYDAGKDLWKVLHYMHFYGFESQVFGAPDYRVDSGILTFVNHGCDGSANMGTEAVANAVTEMTVDASSMPKTHGRLSDDHSIHHVVLDRHINQAMAAGDFAIRAIKAGEEITNNYLAFTGDSADWEEDVKEMREWCAKEKAAKKTE